MIVAVVVLNQVAGPPLLKYAIRHVGEDNECGGKARHQLESPEPKLAC